jgi:hypothetical protein
VKKILLFYLLLVIFGVKSFSQDSLKTSSYCIGITSALIDNISAIRGGPYRDQFRSAGHKLGIGYTQGACFLYKYENLLFEFAVQFTQENDRFSNVPPILSRQVVADSTHTYTQNYLDYEHTVNVYLRFSSFAFLLKLNVEIITGKKVSAGFGLGIAPYFITSGTIYNSQTGKYEKQLYGNHDGDSHIKTVGSINLICSLTNKLLLKVSPIVSYYLTKRSMAGYYIHPFNFGIEFGLFYKLK